MNDLAPLSTLDYRVITDSDLPPLRDLFKISLAHSGSPELFPYFDSAVSNLLRPEVQQSGIGRIFGGFAGSTLQMSLHTLVSDSQVCYFVNRIFINPDYENSQVAKDDLFKACVSYYEYLGYRRFYTLEKDNLLVDKISPPLLDLPGYTQYTELLVDNNERPKQSDLWEKLYERKLFPYRTAVRVFINPCE